MECNICTLDRKLSRSKLCLPCSLKYQRCNKCRQYRYKEVFGKGMYCKGCTKKLWQEEEIRKSLYQEYKSRRLKDQED